VDDVQFIAGKERTQEEFFFTFNALYETGKQIVITSDKMPKDTPGLEERLKTRFVWGMTADIGAPDFETKVAILQKKAAEQNFALPSDVAHYIAERARSNVRELEGCLIKVIFHASLHGADIDVPMAQEVLRGIIREPSRSASIDQIQRIVGEHFQVRVADLKSKNRSQSFALPRQVAMYLSRDLSRASTTEIGRRFGGKDHSTVIHSTNKIREMMRKDPEFAATIQLLREKAEASV
jgi:chromosomal replication initiator protein